MATFGEKLKTTRKKFGWSQDELGKKVGIHGRHVGKYENNKAMPNAETIIRISKTLKVSIDYLLLNNLDENTTPTVLLKDSDLIRKFEAVEKMAEDDRHVVLSLIDAYIKKQQMETVLKQ